LTIQGGIKTVRHRGELPFPTDHLDSHSAVPSIPTHHIQGGSSPSLGIVRTPLQRGGRDTWHRSA
jgi:hypothetical protein